MTEDIGLSKGDYVNLGNFALSSTADLLASVAMMNAGIPELNPIYSLAIEHLGSPGFAVEKIAGSLLIGSMLVWRMRKYPTEKASKVILAAGGIAQWLLAYNNYSWVAPLLPNPFN